MGLKASLFLELGCLLCGLLAHRLLLQRLLIAHSLPLLCRLLLSLNLALSPPASVAEVLLSRREFGCAETCGLYQSSDPPVILPVAVIFAKAQQSVRLARGGTSDLNGNSRCRKLGFRDRRANCVRGHVQSALALGVPRVWEGVLFVEDDADVLSVGMLCGIAVVFDVASRHGVDGVITAHLAVLSGPPQCSSLLVENVAGNDELICEMVSRVQQFKTHYSSHTSCSLRAQLLGDASLALLLVCSLRLDGGVPVTLNDVACQLWDPGRRGCNAWSYKSRDSSHQRPLKREEPHGR